MSTFVIDGRGLRPVERAPFKLQINVEYPMGASHSPDTVIVVRVENGHTGELVRYKAVPYDGGERVMERSIFEDLTLSGIRTQLAYFERVRQGLTNPPAWVGPAIDRLNAIMRGEQVPAIDPADYARVEVRCVEVLGVDWSDVRSNDPWYAAEEYGGVGGFEHEGRRAFAIHTDVRRARELADDPRFEILDVTPRARRED